MDFTFLTKDQIWDDWDDALDVMKRYGTKAALTDLTVILGGYISNGNYESNGHTSEGDPSGDWWSQSARDNPFGTGSDVFCVDSYGGCPMTNPQYRNVSARPALSPSEASKISPSITRTINGISVAEYGEYPQTVVDKRTSKKLEKLHKSKSLSQTGKNYTFDSVGLCDYDTSFKAKSYQEYEMDGKRYIRIPGRPTNGDNVLSTGEQVKAGKPYWVEVQPIEWLIDKGGTMVAKKCLFAGIQFDTKSAYNFPRTFMKHYLDTYFAKEIEPSERVADRVENKKEAETLKKLITSKLSSLRAFLKGTVNPKTSAEEKKARPDSASKVLQDVKGKRYY